MKYFTLVNRRQMICAALAGVILVVLISLIAVYKATPQQPLLPLPLRPGEVADPSSRFVKLWPGRMGYFKFSDGLIFAIPPQYQPFWLRSWPLQRDQVARDLKSVVNAKPTEVLAFQFFYLTLVAITKRTISMIFIRRALM